MPIRNRKTIVSLSLLMLFLVACASTPEPPQPPQPMTSCRSGDVVLDAQFEGGQLGQCKPAGEGVFALDLYPEDAPPINESPWYAFRVSAGAGAEIKVMMNFIDGYARYWPKISINGWDWEPAPAAWVTLSSDGKRMELATALTGPWLWIAGQELVTNDWFQAWNEELSHADFAQTQLGGTSVLGRPIYVTETPDREEFVLLVGRQHPPEVTGTLTMKPFMDVVMGNSELARQFRERYKLVIYPLLNPDGVAMGHWRHNVNGVDLNRDWGPFTQPETRLVKERVDELVAAGIQPRLMLDFHSTKSNLFYTQLTTEPTEPRAFATEWLNASRARLPGYDFLHDARGVSDRPTTKNYFHTTYGIPAITYETGDETDRTAIRNSAVVFAEEMMRLLLAYTPD